jgi:hypothetical protein
VQRLERENLQQEKVEGALDEVGRLAHERLLLISVS